MTFFPSRTTFIKVGPFSIQWYAVLILTGAIIAYLFSKKNLKSYRNVDINGFFDDLFVYMLWGGVIGARLWYCLFDSTTNYFENPLQIFRIWDGGVAFHGCFAGGLVVIYYFCKKKNVSIIKFCDAVIPTVLFAQAMGRWGNFINQECYGGIVDESYYNGILSFIKDDMFIKGAYREPMFLYESCLCFLGFIIINFILRKFQNKRGDLIWAYLMWYGVVRFFIEARRTDSLYMNFVHIKTAQLTSVLYLIIGLLGYFGVYEKLFKKKKPTILFDLDGTLQDSEKAIQETYRELFRRHDDEKNFTPERQLEILGPALFEIFPKYFPNEDPKALFDEYQDIIKNYLPDSLKEIPHADEVLKELANKGYDVGVVTTRSIESTKNCMAITGQRFFIDDFVGLEDVKKVKPDTEAYIKITDRNYWNKDDVIVIGDSVADIKGGQDFGAYTIGFVFNEGKRKQLEDAKPNKVITDLRDILDILNEDHYFTYNLK